MEPVHHKKIMVVVGILVLVVVIILGIVAIVGHKTQPVPVQQPGPAPALTADDYSRATSVAGHSSIADPDVQKYIKGTSVPKGSKGAGNRDGYVKATSII